MAGRESQVAGRAPRSSVPGFAPSPVAAPISSHAAPARQLSRARSGPYDDEPAPSYAMSEFIPSTVPGCRAPHLWLRNGRSLYDALGPWYTLLRRDPTLAVDDLTDAAARCGLPLRVLDLDADQHAPLYPFGLVLVRPDQHVAWRGHTVPTDVHALVALLRGAHPHSEV